MCATRPKLPLGQMWNHVYSPKAVGTLIPENVMDIVSLLYVTYIFFLFYRIVGFGENIKYAKKFITPAMEFAYVAAFTLAM